jgi:hypothetical protein
METTESKDQRKAQCSLLGKDQARKRRKLEGTDFQTIRFNLSKVKELATALGARQKKKKA